MKQQCFFVLQVKWIAFVCILVDRNSTNVAMGGRSGRFVLGCSVIIRFQVEGPGGLQSCSTAHFWYVLPGMPLFSFLYSSSDMVQLDSNLNYEFLSNNSDLPYTYFRLQFFLEYAYIIFLIYLKNLTLSKGVWCSSDETAHIAHK